MHFCFITGLYSRYDVLMFERQGKSLVEAGFKVTYIVCDNLPNEIKEGISIVSTGYSPKNRIDRFLNTKKILLEYINRIDADVYQISDPELISLVVPLRRKNKKVIFNLREYYPDMIKSKPYIPKIFRGLVSYFYSQNMRFYLKRYDVVFVVTTWIIDILKDDFKLNNFELLTNFPILNQEYNLTFEEYSDRENVLCYIGTVYKSSKQDKIFQALTNISDIRYLIAGVIDENNDLEKFEYWKKVEFINGFNYNEMPKIMSKATISNTLRDFGKNDGSLGVIKIFESMEAALPVLLSDVPLYRAIVDKYRCGICVDINEPKQIENAIRYLIDNKKEAYQMGQNGRRAVIEEFNWGKQAERYINKIKSI